jgi:hypothetical protein
MARDPKECRKNALRCAEVAERATDAQLSEVLNMLAKRWVQLALELERAQAFRNDQRRTELNARKR